MGLNDYHFVTHWRVRGPIQLVYDILKDGEGYSRWWRPAYVSTTSTGDKKIRALVRARLPYTLDFATEPVRENPPFEFEIRSTGELSGRGLWKLRQEGEMTAVDFFWDVRAEKPLVKLLSPILKPLFKWNHDWVMKVGEKGLQQEIEHRSSLRLGRPKG